VRSWFQRTRLSEFEQKIVNNVDKHGCHISAVFDPDGGEASFAYSVGFTKTLDRVSGPNSPEVIAFGLPNDVYGPAINELLAMCAAGFQLAEGERIPQFFGDYDCIVRMVHQSWIEEAYFNSAIWYHRTQMGRDFQNAAMLVWPDADHVLPWEEGCAEWVCAAQPPLYLPRLNA